MAKTNVPYWYGIVDGTTVNLYVLVYADSATIAHLSDVGSIKNYQVSSSGTSQTPNTAHFTFTKGSFDTIKIHFNFSGATKVVEIAIDDLDLTSATAPVLDLPTLSGSKALDTPYIFTHRIQNTSNRFDAEMVIFPSAGKTFTTTQTGPDAGKNTLSDVVSSAGATTAFDMKHEFTVTNVDAGPGGHVFAYANGTKRRSRTKNINHTKIPFPRSRKN